MNDNIIKPKIYLLKDVYVAYAIKLLKENPEYWSRYNRPMAMSHYWIYVKKKNKVVEVINFNRWLNIINTYIAKGMAHIIDGDVFILGHNLGKIAGKHIERNHKNKQVNWEETRKQPRVLNPVTGRMIPEKFIYFTEDSYARIGWFKTKKLTNETVYEFAPTFGKKGFKAAFSRANRQNQMLKFKYQYFPYILKEV